MNRELIVPNLHVILIHYPLGLFMTGVIIELLSVFWRRHSVRVAGHWMVLLGGLSMVPTALSGIYALHDVAVQNVVTSGMWADTASQSPLSEAAWESLRNHVLYTSISTAIIVAVIVFYLGASDGLRKRLYFPLLGVLLFGTVMMSVAAWHAGEAIYRHGVAVEPAGLAVGEKAVKTEQAEPTTASMEAKPLYAKINTVLPPIQPHAVLAGIATAIALASIGVAFRRITSELPEVTDDRSIDTAESLVQSLHVPAEPPVQWRPAKFWLAAMLFFILTSLGGWYVLGSDSENFSPKELWANVVNRDLNNGHPLNRRLAHVIAAAATILLPLLLAIAGKWAPRQKLPLIILSVLLIAAIGVQVWLGVLLIFDSPMGPVTGFN